jgi:hypothetical protein
MRFWRTLCICSALTCGLASVVRADSYGTARIAYEGCYGGIAGFWADYNYDGTWDRVYNNNVYTGQYQFAFDDAASSPQAAQFLSNPFGAFCIDVTQQAGGWALYNIVDLEDAPASGAVGHMSQAKADAVRELFGRVMSTNWSSANPGQGGYIGGGPLAAEAFGACLWEIVFEKPGLSYNINDGYFRMNGMDGCSGAVAQAWLNRLTGDPLWRDQQVLAMVNDNMQDFAFAAPGFSHQDDEQAIPEPMTMAAVGMGVAALAAYIRGRKAAACVT